MASMQVYSSVEVFAGKANVTKCLALAGLKVAALDIGFWSNTSEERLQSKIRGCKTNPMDILSASGFAPLGCLIATSLPPKSAPGSL